MTDVTLPDLRNRIAAAFDRRGWPYEPGLSKQMLAGLSPGTELNAEDLARRVPADYLDRNKVDRARLAASLAEIGGLTLVTAPTAQTLVVNDNRYQVNVSDQGKIESSNINVVGEPINVSVSTSRHEVLVAMRVLLAAAFGGDWNEDALVELARLIDDREDISVEDVRSLTAEVGAEGRVEPGRIRGLLEKVGTGTLTGVLSTGLSAGLGHLLANPPT